MVLNTSLLVVLFLNPQSPMPYALLSLLLHSSEWLPGILLLQVRTPPLSAFILPFPWPTCAPSPYQSLFVSKILQLHLILCINLISSWAFSFKLFSFEVKEQTKFLSKTMFPSACPTLATLPSNLTKPPSPLPIWLTCSTHHMSPCLLIRSHLLFSAGEKHQDLTTSGRRVWKKKVENVYSKHTKMRVNPQW